MFSHSSIYKLDDTTEKFSLYQTIDTAGAWDIEYFVIADKHYLAVANTHDGGSAYKLNSVIYQWNGHQFAVFQNIPTNGATSVTFFQILQEQFLTIANSFDGTSHRINSVIYKWKDNQFEKFQDIGTVGAEGSTVFAINSETFIVFANYGDHRSYRVDSTVFKWSGKRFVKMQDLQTTGAYDVKALNINDDTFLAFANHQSGEHTYNVNSSIYKWDGNKFIVFQLIPTHGAFAWHSFLICGETFLGVANWGNHRTGDNTKSVVYQYAGQKFIKYQEISTKEASDMTSYEYKGHLYLVITSFDLYSMLYKWG